MSVTPKHTHKRRKTLPAGDDLSGYQRAIKELKQIPGVGTSIANDLWNINIKSVAALAGKDPEHLYGLSNKHAGMVQDRCLLYVFRCAVYYAGTPPEMRDPEKLKWWNWK